MILLLKQTESPKIRGTKSHLTRGKISQRNLVPKNSQRNVGLKYIELQIDLPK